MSHRILLALLFPAALLGACADSPAQQPEAPAPHGAQIPPGDPDGDVRALVIVGEHDVFVDEAGSARLAVKYVDGDGKPLAGRVAFAVVDLAAASGASLDAQAVTGADGQAASTLRAGHVAAFEVVASADRATPVRWRVAVRSAQQPEQPLEYAGSYTLDSELDLGANLPGIVGGSLRTLGDLTDGPNDPATFLIDQVLEHIGSGTLTSAVGTFRPGIDQGLNGFILAEAPELVSTLRNVGTYVNMLVRHLKVRSELTLAAKLGANGALAGLDGKHVLKSVHLEIGNTRADYALSQLDLGEPTAEHIDGSGTNQAFTLAEHRFAMSYGRIVLFGLKQVIIPELVPGATDVAGVLAHFIHCDGVARWVLDHIGLGTESMWSSACSSAITAVGGVVEGEILVIDQTAAELHLAGVAKVADLDGDHKIDRFSDGAWKGRFVVAGQTSMLDGAPANHFDGARPSRP